MNPEELKVKKIGVLMGGLSGEREISLRSGRNCLRALQAQGYHAVSIDAVRDVGQVLDEEQREILADWMEEQRNCEINFSHAPACPCCSGQFNSSLVPAQKRT